MGAEQLQLFSPRSGVAVPKRRYRTVKERRFVRRNQSDLILRCPACGNTSRFLEVMEMETHIVDGNLNYIELVDAWPDHYTCVNCLEIIEPKDISSFR